MTTTPITEVREIADGFLTAGTKFLDLVIEAEAKVEALKATITGPLAADPEYRKAAFELNAFRKMHAAVIPMIGDAAAKAIL